MPTTIWRICLMMAVLILPNIGLGQDEDSDPAAANDPKPLLQEWDRLIYVPFQELKDVIDNQKSSAVIPYAEYLELMKLYLEHQNSQSENPDAVITSASYEAEVEADVVRIRAILEINLVKKEGWKSLNLPFSNCAVGSLETDEKDCLLKGQANGKYDLWIKGSGAKKVTINLLTAVVRSSEHQSFSIHCPATAIGSLNVVIPKADQDVSILPLQVLLPSDSKDGEDGDSEDDSDGDNDEEGFTVVQASLASTNQFEVRWNPKASSKPEMDLLASVHNDTRASIEPGLVQSTTKLHYEVLRGELKDASVVVPKNARIIDVAASAGQIRSWDVVPNDDDESGSQLLKMDLLNPIRDAFAVTIETEQDLKEESISLLGRSSDGKVHGIHAVGVIRESGTIVVTTDSSLTATAREMSGIKRTRRTEKSSLEQQAWSFIGQTGRLVLQVAPVKPRLLADQNATITFADDQIQLSSEMTYTVERAGVFQLAIRYPEDLVIDSVRADGMTEFKSDENKGLLTLSLARKRLGQITVSLKAHRPFDSTVALDSISLPMVVADGVEREEGRLKVLAPQFLDIITIDEETQGLFPDQQAVRRPSQGVRVVSAWKYSQQPVALSVRTTPRSAQLSGTVATTAKIEPNVIAMNSAVNFSIRNAGIDTFRISVPESIASDVRFRSLNPRQSIQQRDQGDAADGRVTWTLVLQNEVTGDVPFSVDWEIPVSKENPEGVSEEINRETTLNVSLPEIVPPFDDDQDSRRDVTMTGITGELRLLRHDSLSVSADAVDDSMQVIDVRELKLMSSSGYLAFRYFEQPAAVQIAITRHEVQEVVKTVVSKAAVEVVTDKQQLASFLCQYEITSSERQRLRIDVPAKAELQAPLLNSSRTTFEAAQDIAAESGWEPFYVNVSRKTTSDQPFVLTLQFRSPIADENGFPFQGQGGTQIFKLPRLTSSEESVVVQETRLAVYHPQNIALVGDDGRWKSVGQDYWNWSNPLVSSHSAEEASKLQSWISNAPAATEFSRQGNVSIYRSLGHQPTIKANWWNRPFLVAIMSAALLLIGLILRRTSWENRLTIVVIAALAIGVWSLNDKSETMQFVTAGLPGLAAVGVIWVVSSLRSLIRTTTPDTPGSSPDDSNPQPPDSPPSSDGSDPKSKIVPFDESASAENSNEQNTVRPSVDSSTAAPAAVSPSPDVSRMIQDMMGGQS